MSWPLASGHPHPSPSFPCVKWFWGGALSMSFLGVLRGMYWGGVENVRVGLCLLWLCRD